MCNDPTCRLCNSSLDYFMRYEPPMRRTYLSPALDEVNEAIVNTIVKNMQSALMKDTGGSMSNSTIRPIIEDIRRLHKKGEDIQVISKEIDAILSTAKAELLDSLSGLANLELRKPASGHRFVLVYWQNNEAKVAEGIDYARDEIIKEDDEGKQQRVFVYDGQYPIPAFHFTMSRFKKQLNDRNIPHIVVYRDK